MEPAIRMINIMQFCLPSKLMRILHEDSRLLPHLWRCSVEEELLPALAVLLMSSARKEDLKGTEVQSKSSAASSNYAITRNGLLIIASHHTCALVPNQWQLSTAMLILVLHFSTTCRSCVPNQVRSLCIIESVASPALRCWTWVEPCSCVRKLGNYTSKKNIFYKACIT